MYTLEDVIFAFPHRYEIFKIADYGEKGVLQGIYENHAVIRTRSGKRMLKAVFRSDSGFFTGIWLNFKGEYPANTLKKGNLYYLYGVISKNDGVASIFHPEFIKADDMGKVKPVYSLPGAMTQNTYRRMAEAALKLALNQVCETLPDTLLDKYCFPAIKDAINTLHNPKTFENASEIVLGNHPAYQRFVYYEFFYTQIAMEKRRKGYTSVEGIKFNINKDFLNTIKELLPFKLTSAQRHVLVEIFNDMMSSNQMNRLVQGDVGSGKTIVAFIAAAAAADNGYQTVLIAPTEVLAEQHFFNMQKFFKDSKYPICLLTGSVGKKDKIETKNLIASGIIKFIIGTHALLEENVEFSRLGLVIVDEQHRFGVRQRKSLMDKGFNPDVLLMTATPIPRTLAMTLYGDLDVSIIDEMPPGRIPCITKHYLSKNLNEALNFVKDFIDKGNRAYFIYPLIDESDSLDLKAATKSYEYISEYFKGKKTGLLHGKMKSEEKISLLNKFKTGDLDILVSTTVVEVGVDVPEANIIVIENAERFGLSQLHQLRGRVGRSNKQSYCILVSNDDISKNGQSRIKAMLKYTDGFKLAEIDLELRGQGDFFGTKQSGVPEFKFANLIRDMKILQSARNDAKSILENDPELEQEQHSVIKEMLLNFYKNENSYFGIG
ncbi:MAG: ATP-dependent DNA helicase RecG [Deferribacterales bacterium]|nr:ATP-dependent DNA helicase RecG [Deferribacterales bacterium]